LPLSKEENWMSGKFNGEVKAAQTYLSKHGYYVGAVDGLFGPKTESATLLFQTSSGLTSPDGVIDESTKRAMTRPRYDHQNDVPDSTDENSSALYKYSAGERVQVSVGSSPGYLEREVSASSVNSVRLLSWFHYSQCANAKKTKLFSLSLSLSLSLSSLFSTPYILRHAGCVECRC
jgi:hypothetical protein